MKKLLSLILALALILSVAAASADPTEINGKDKRNIKINEAGLNPSAEEMIEQNISPTTGRQLDTIDTPDGSLGTAVTGLYVPVLVQISNADGGVEENYKGEPSTAPIGMEYADIVYEACQAYSANGGTLTRFTALFSDVVPELVGFVRSTRLTHCRIRQEWDCAFCTSGYSPADVKPEWKILNVKNPEAATPTDPGLVYVGDFPKVWKQYVTRLYPGVDANSELFELANIVQNIIPKDHQAANHTYKFTDEAPEGGDSAEIIYVNFGKNTRTNSRLEYNTETNTYERYVPLRNGDSIPFRAQNLVNPHQRKNTTKNAMMIDADVKEFGEYITFTNIIVQGINMKWRGSERPDPVLTGTGVADYFMNGKHYQGVWQRKDINDRTVFYGEDGNEISLLRGKTLIILMDYTGTGAGVLYE